MAVVTPTAKAQFIDAAGVPLAGGLLYTYAAGTTTPQATYTDSAATTPNSNPIVLDARGEANIWLGSATYKFKLADANNTELWTVDNISAPTTALSPVLSGNVVIDTNSSGTALTINQAGNGALIKSVDTVTPSTVYFTVTNIGHIGINTASPSSEIDVADGAIQLSSAGGAARTVLSADATDSIFEASDDRNFTIKTNNVARLTINSTDATSTIPVVLPGVPTTALQAATKSYVDLVMPPGSLMAYAASTAPSGWLSCNGAAVLRATYADLFSAISTTWGTGDGSTTFNVPDLRGQFLRGYDSRVPGSGALDTTTFAGTTTSGNATISGISSLLTAYLYAGMPITGAGISASTTIATVSNTSITISANATATSTALAGTTTSGSYNVTSISTTAALAVGQTVTGTGIPSGTTIVSIVSGTAILLSAAATATGTPTLTFQTTLTVGRTFAGAQDDQFESHAHPIGDPTHTHTVGQYTTTNNALSLWGSGTGSNVNSALTGVLDGYLGNAETRPKNYAVLYIIKT
jgi:microcystin-dependent protein